jgi:hypothetical protein
LSVIFLQRRRFRSVVVRAAETKEASTQELPQKQSEVEGKVPAKKEPEAAKEKPKAPTRRWLAAEGLA